MLGGNNLLLIRRRLHPMFWVVLLFSCLVFGGGAWFLMSLIWPSHPALALVLPGVAIVLLIAYAGSLSRTVAVRDNPTGGKRVVVARSSVLGHNEMSYQGVTTAEVFHLGLLDDENGPGVVLVTTSADGFRRRALSTSGGREDCWLTVEDIRKVATAINGMETPIIDAQSHEQLRLSKPSRTTGAAAESEDEVEASE